MKKRNLNVLVALVVGVVVLGGVVLANGRGLMGSINQNRSATRAEVAKSVAIAISEDDDYELFFGDYHGCFQDVEDKPYQGYVCYLFDLGLIRGDNDGNFRPKSAINRAEAAKLFFSAYESVIEEPVDVPNGSPYRDVNIGDWYFDYVAKIAKLGIPDVMGWKNKNFKPGADFTVGQLGNWSRKLERVLR